MFGRSLSRRRLSMVGFTGSFNVKTAATTGLRRDSELRNSLGFSIEF